jgi:hypothetical protein
VVGGRAPCPWAPREGNESWDWDCDGEGMAAGELLDFCRLGFTRLGFNLSVSPFGSLVHPFAAAIGRPLLSLSKAIRWDQVLHAGAKSCQIEVSIYFLVQYKNKFGC